MADAFPGSNEANEKIREASERFEAQDFDAARALLMSVLEEFPNHAKAKQILGVIAYVQGDHDTASRHLSESVDPETASPIATQVFAATNLRLNNPKKVLEILEQSIAQSSNAATWALYGMAAVADRQLDKGEHALKKAIDLAPENARYRIALANFYRDARGGNPKAELQQLEKAYSVAPTNMHVLRELLSYHLRMESPQAAQKFVEDNLQKYPKSAAVSLIAGYYQISRSDLNKAYEHFEKAANLASQDEERMAILIVKGQLELSLQKFGAAESTFREFIKRFGRDHQGYSGLYAALEASKGKAEAQQQLLDLAKRNAIAEPLEVLIHHALAKADIDKAKEYREHMRQLKPKSEHLLSMVDKRIAFMEAAVAVQNKDYDAARTIVAELLVQEPEEIQWLSMLVDIEMGAGQLREAEKVIQQIEGLNPQHIAVPLLSAQLELARENLAGAREFLEKAWSLAPSENTADRLYRVLATQNDAGAQLNHLNDWLQKLPNSAGGYQARAMYYQMRGEAAPAKQDYEQLLRLQPENVLALNNLGWLYFETKDSRAKSLLEKAVGLAPENAAVLDSYGWVLVNTGKVKEGLVYLEKAAKLSPDTAEIQEHLEQARKMK